MEYKNEIFIYLQSYYRAFMRDRAVEEFPVFEKEEVQTAEEVIDEITDDQKFEKEFNDWNYDRSSSKEKFNDVDAYCKEVEKMIEDMKKRMK